MGKAERVGSISAYSIAPTSGALTAVPGSPFAAGKGADFIALTPSGQFAYVANSIPTPLERIP